MDCSVTSNKNTENDACLKATAENRPFSFSYRNDLLKLAFDVVKLNTEVLNTSVLSVTLIKCVCLD